MHRLDTEHNAFGNHRLFEYAIEGRSKKLQKIFERDGNIPVDITNNKGQTLLYVACLYQRFKVVALLLQFGADPNYRCSDGSTPTHAAAYSSSVEILRSIVEDYGGDMRLHDKQMRTPRDWAIRAGSSINRKILRLIETWQQQVDKRMHAREKYRRGTAKVTCSEELLKSNLEIDYCGYGSFLRSSRSQGSGYIGFTAVVPLASPTHITTSGNLSLSFSVPPSFVMEEALWCHYRVMIKRSKGKSCISRSSEDMLISEAKACRSLRHPCLLLLMAICVASPEESYNATTDCYWLVYEYVHFGSLYHVLHVTKKNFLPTESVKILLQIADALSFIHQRGFVHCAVSSHAIYLSHGLIAKLGDMGYVASIGNKTHIQDQALVLPHFARWVAPEVILKETVTQKADLYSFCVVMCETFSGSLPWYGCDNKSIEGHIRNRRNYFMIPDWLPKELLQMLGNGLKFHSYNRITNLLDLQGCAASLLQNGVFDRIVTCLGDDKTSKIFDSTFNPSQFDSRVNKTKESPSASTDIPGYKPGALYAHLMADCNVCDNGNASFGDFCNVQGEDVPDARPFNDTEPSKTSMRKDAEVDNPSRSIADLGGDNIIEVTADVHISDEQHSVPMDACNVNVKDKSMDRLLPPRQYLEQYSGPTISRPHSCSILTQDGCKREILPNARHNSFPDITCEKLPPSYSHVIRSQISKKPEEIRNLEDIEDQPRSPAGPPNTIYSPTSTLPLSLTKNQPRSSKCVTSSTASSKSSRDCATQTNGRQGSEDLSSSFANTSDHPSMPLSQTSNTYPSSSEQHPGSSTKKLDTTSAQNSHTDVKSSNFSESTDIPDSIFAAENVPPPEYVHFSAMSVPNSRHTLDVQSVNSHGKVITQGRKVTLPNSDCSSLALSMKVEPSRKVFRTASHKYDRRQGLHSKRTRWSTSALVERRINHGEFSMEEMYNIDHSDLEYIFESFAERRNPNDFLLETPPNIPAQLYQEVRDTLFADKASQTDLVEGQIDNATDRSESAEAKGDQSGPQKLKVTSVCTNTDGGMPTCLEQEGCTKKANVKDKACVEMFSDSVKPNEIVTHCKDNPPFCVPPTPDKGLEIMGDGTSHSGVMLTKECTDTYLDLAEDGNDDVVKSGTLSASDSNLSTSHEYLYSQEFIIPVHAEDCTSAYENDRFSGRHSVGDQVEEGLNSFINKIPQQTDTDSLSLQSCGVKKSEVNDTQRRSLESDQTEFLTCFDLDSEDASMHDAIQVKEAKTDDLHIFAQSVSPPTTKTDLTEMLRTEPKSPVEMAALGEAGECAGKANACESDSMKQEVDETEPENMNVVSQTPSKWPFHKKLCVFKAVADSGSNSDLGKKVMVQNAFSKVRQTAEMFENMTPPPSPRDAASRKVNSQPYPSGSDETYSSTPDSSKFLQERVGQNFETSTPVSINEPVNDKVKCKSAVNPRTFEEVRRDIEISSMQKCHFAEGNDRKCFHESEANNEDKTDAQDAKYAECSQSSDEGLDPPVTFVADRSNSYEELMISPASGTEVRRLVKNIVSNMIDNALCAVENIHTESSNSDSEDIGDGVTFARVANGVKASKSLPANMNAVHGEPHLPSVRMTQSEADIRSMAMDVSSERVAQEYSSISSDVDERQKALDYFRSVDTSIWSL